MDPLVSFPTFKDWPTCKIFYVNHMSVAQKDTDKELVVVSDEYHQKFSRCAMCSERFVLTFDLSLEAWVYKSCRELRGVPYHFPLCWQYAHSRHD